jgi:hypothetical protein
MHGVMLPGSRRHFHTLMVASTRSLARPQRDNSNGSRWEILERDVLRLLRREAVLPKASGGL